MDIYCQGKTLFLVSAPQFLAETRGSAAVPNIVNGLLAHCHKTTTETILLFFVLCLLPKKKKILVLQVKKDLVSLTLICLFFIYAKKKQGWCNRLTIMMAN